MNLTISKQTARRFILGCQGLWPGRRWSGLEGTEAALRTMEACQVDTISAVARQSRSHVGISRGGLSAFLLGESALFGAKVLRIWRNPDDLPDGAASALG